jgi:hypothetical protein
MSFIVDNKPERAGIDPDYLLIDKNTENNKIKVLKVRRAR